jgi:hypothetical protein
LIPVDDTCARAAGHRFLLVLVVIEVIATALAIAHRFPVMSFNKNQGNSIGKPRTVKPKQTSVKPDSVSGSDSRRQRPRTPRRLFNKKKNHLIRSHRFHLRQKK